MASKCSFTPGKLRFLGHFCLASAASPTFFSSLLGAVDVLGKFPGHTAPGLPGMFAQPPQLPLIILAPKETRHARDRRLDPVLQPPAPTPGAGHENTRRGLCFSSLTCADSAGSLHNRPNCLIRCASRFESSVTVSFSVCSREKTVVCTLFPLSAYIWQRSGGLCVPECNNERTDPMSVTVSFGVCSREKPWSVPYLLVTPLPPQNPGRFKFR